MCSLTVFYGRDHECNPTVGSSVMITILNGASSFFIFLSLAWIRRLIEIFRTMMMSTHYSARFRKPALYLMLGLLV